MFRTLATVLENLVGAEVPATFTEARDAVVPSKRMERLVEQYGFQRGEERIIAFWLPGKADENGSDFAPLALDVSVQVPNARQVTLIDVLNGTETSLNVSRSASGLFIPKVHAQSWPRLLRISE